jgi:N-acetylglucosaminyldiphosphoundecaprenol N-acetyl-beta-D-mannosaminyltransferase
VVANGEVPRSEIAGVPLSDVDVGTVMRVMESVINEKSHGHYISITNTESIYHALRIPAHRVYINNADFSLCDGVGVIVAGWFWGHRIRRLNGPILQLEASRHGTDRGWRHFYYGGKEGVADLMADRLKKNFPGLNVIGTYAPPFRPLTPEEDESVVRMINQSGADIVWVGLGLLRQEEWIAKHIQRITVPWMVGVGAAFDYHAGVIPWAPSWMRALGLEWLFRLVIQPRLRAKRYWWSFVFVLEAAVKGLVDSLRRATKKVGGTQ